MPSGARELDVELVIDRLVAKPDQRSRLADSLELAFREGRDRAIVLAQPAAEAPWRELRLSQALACEICGDPFERLTPRHFSFNHGEGACRTCGGLGRKLRFVPELVVPDPAKSIREGAIKAWRIGGKNLIIKHNLLLKQLAEQLPFDPDAPWRDLPGGHAGSAAAGRRAAAVRVQAAPDAGRPAPSPLPASSPTWTKASGTPTARVSARG